MKKRSKKSWTKRSAKPSLCRHHRHRPGCGKSSLRTSWLRRFSLDQKDALKNRDTPSTPTRREQTGGALLGVPPSAARTPTAPEKILCGSLAKARGRQRAPARSAEAIAAARPRRRVIVVETAGDRPGRRGRSSKHWSSVADVMTPEFGAAAGSRSRHARSPIRAITSSTQKARRRAETTCASRAAEQGGVRRIRRTRCRCTDHCCASKTMARAAPLHALAARLGPKKA